MYMNATGRRTYANIITKIKTQIPLKPEMIIKEEIIGIQKKRSGEEIPVKERKLNVEFWRSIKEPINVVLDEAHTIINSRRSMSKTNIILTDWIALIRRVLGSNDAGHGELVLITQLPNRIDSITRDMATQVRYHQCHYNKICSKCKTTWYENSDMPERLWICPRCGSGYIKKTNHKLQVWFFANMRDYLAWSEWGMNTYYKCHMINDVEKYFKLYDTLQWENMFGDYY